MVDPGDPVKAPAVQAPLVSSTVDDIDLFSVLADSWSGVNSTLSLFNAKSSKMRLNDIIQGPAGTL